MKPLNWLALLLLLCLFAAFAVVACGDDDDDDDDDSGDDADKERGLKCTDDVCTDGESGLTWQNGSDCCHQWADAKTYCQDLVLGDYDDWRLPTISELRSLLRGCALTETDGSCGVTDSCLSFDPCRDDSCDGCSENGGEGPGGLYWPPELNGECCWYWSSSAVEGGDVTAWYIYFDYGYVFYANVYTENFVRCVR
ncbi:MAG: DUF1566 domain-containing protein [Candidatus Lernaella stagnicola]|nr:DUF1566 domain-containing protein [Candidatus Lernaella stagnicola]